MAGKYNPTVVGTDAFFREICIGDEIQDLDGRHYTVDRYGRCKPLDGGNTVPLSSVKEAALVSRYEGPPLDVTEHKPAPRPAPKPEKKPEPKTDPAIVQGTVSPRGGRSNRSGMTSFWNLSRSAGVPAAQLKEIAQEHGFEIVRANGVNRNTGIRIEDVDRLRALLPERPAQEQKSAAPPKEKKTLPEEVIPLQIPDETVKTLCNIETGDTRDWNLASTPDQELAAELRRRGYVVTAIKHVEL